MKALLSYYHPLNQSRAFGVANRGLQRGFFEGLSTIHDFGCGTGAAALGMTVRALSASPGDIGLQEQFATLSADLLAIR